MNSWKTGFDYNPGEHISIVQPTGGGKSYLAYQLVDNILNDYPSLRFASLMPKPKDPTTVAFMQQLNLRETAVWPPTRHFWEPVPRGHVFWPKHNKLIPAEQNSAQLAAKFRQMLNAQYWHEGALTLGDDVFTLSTLGLTPELEQLWTAGRTMPSGLITCNQKPSGTNTGQVSSHSYSQPSHFFFGKDGNQANRQRIGEIGLGLDPKMLSDIVANLKVHRINGSPVSDLLYLDRRGPAMAIVTP